MEPLLELTKPQISAVFNEWARQFAEDPKAFSDVLDDKGHPIPDYGDKCAVEFKRLAVDLGFL